MDTIKISSTSFEDGGLMPKKYTGFGENVSPQFTIKGLSESVKSIAIITDDLDVPFVKEFTHWIIWNIPKTDAIPEAVPHGETVNELGGAVQGKAWGVSRYRGPKQPPFIKKAHRYIFRFYALDCLVELDARSGKKELLSAMKGHVLQQGKITGVYKPE